MTARKRQEKYLDRITSLKVREAAKEADIACYFAGRDKVRCNGAIQCNHIIGRANKRLRWDYHNVVPGCAGHNLYYHHNEPDLHKLISEIDPIRWAYLERMKWVSGKMEMADLRLIEAWILAHDYVYERILLKEIR